MMDPFLENLKELPPDIKYLAQFGLISPEGFSRVSAKQTSLTSIPDLAE